MKRWIIGACLIGASACQVTETSSVEQYASVCSPGSYPNAKLPKMNPWVPGQWKPTATAGQAWIDHADPFVQGRHWAFLVDPGQGVVVWGATVNDNNMPAYRAGLQGTEPMIGDCCRPPPPPPGGDDWLARRAVAAGGIAINLSDDLNGTP